MGDHADIDRQVKTYIVIFITLMALTFVTVAISRIHLPTPTAVALALIVASVKGGLVAGYFMHLISERKLIWWVLWFSLGFFISVMLLPVVTHLDPITN